MTKVELKIGIPERKTGEKIELDLEFLSEIVVKLIKRDILERYKKTGELTEEDWKFCEAIDWHPTDELPLREELVKELKKIEEGEYSKELSPDELEDWFNKL
ncbi:MAG: hypothetical protein DRP10_03590 [Candidatus Aenigmatarchaeota archaeon]|nr:MAG: hypothetical protein DRP10_03590 [Candidatus Aenigmarchaeota archaeon]